jgi:hypothetical protein
VRRLTRYPTGLLGTGLLGTVLGLACGGCSGGPAHAVQVRLHAGPAAAAFDTRQNDINDIGYGELVCCCAAMTTDTAA